MVSWSTIRPVILTLLSDIAVDQITSPGGVHLPLETPKWEAVWKERNQGNDAIHPLQKVALYAKITSSGAKGGDDNRWEELDTGLAAKKAATGLTDVYQVVGGLRTFTINVQAWVPEEEDSINAIAVLDRLRTRIDFTSSRARLLAVNVDLTDLGDIRDMTATKDKRRWSIATMDVFFTCAINDNDPVPVGWIERIILTSHEQNTPGEDVSAPLRMIEETIPPL